MSTPSITTEPDVGASSPAISPSSVDLPLPDGPTIARNCPRGIVVVERVKDRQRLGAAGDCLRDLSQLNHARRCVSGLGRGPREPARPGRRSRGRRRRVGWMPSRWFSDSMPATPSSRNGTSMDDVRTSPSQRSGTTCVKRTTMYVRCPKFGGASIPARTTAIFLAWARSMMSARLRSQLIDRQSAQPVVGAKRDDQHAHVACRAPNRGGAVRRRTYRPRRRR